MQHASHVYRYLRCNTYDNCLAHDAFANGNSFIAVAIQIIVILRQDKDISHAITGQISTFFRFLDADSDML